MFTALWYLLELVLFKNLLELLGCNWMLLFGAAAVVVFLKLLLVGIPQDDYRITYRP